jgi:hypothetical protein
VARPLKSAWKLSQTVRPAVSLSPSDCLVLCWYVWTLDGSPWGNAPPLLLENYALVIPPSESTDMCLKLIAPACCEMGRKDFLGSDLMIAREPQMCPPQVLQPQRLENAPRMVSPLESVEKPGKRCALPFSQLDRKGISRFSLDGINRLNTSSEAVPSP